jgi:hypothetical protein
MGISEGIVVRETALLFESAPYHVKYKVKGIVEVQAKEFFIRAYSTSLCAHVFFRLRFHFCMGESTFR